MRLTQFSLIHCLFFAALGAEAQSAATPSQPPPITTTPVSPVYAPDTRASLGSGASSGWGFAAGWTSGLGIAYRRNLENDWGFQVAGIGYGDRSSIDANLGVHAFRVLHNKEYLRFYLLGGLGWFHSSERTNGDWENSAKIAIGTGIGIEMLLLDKNLGLALELPLTLLFEHKTGTQFKWIYPIPSLALIYYF